MIQVGSGEVTLLPIRTTRWFTHATVPMFGTHLVRLGWHLHGADINDNSDPSAAIEGDIVAQLVDVSGTTPVLSPTYRYPMRPLEGDFPSNFLMRAHRLDSTRILAIWLGDSGFDVVWAQVIQVSPSGGVTFGTPVRLSDVDGNITVNNENGGFVTHADFHTEMTTVVLENGAACIVGRVQRFIYGLGSTNWRDVLATCYVTTSGRSITGVDWWFLNRDNAHDRAAFSNKHYDQGGDSVAVPSISSAQVGGKLAFTYTIRTVLPDGNSYEYRGTTLEWFGGGSDEPTWIEYPLAYGPANHIERARVSNVNYLVLRSGDTFWVTPEDDPFASHLSAVVPPGLGITYTILGGAWHVSLEFSSPSLKGSFWITDDAGGATFGTLKLHEMVFNGSTFSKGRTLTIEVPELPGTIEWYGQILVNVGARTVVVYDYETDTTPFTYREFVVMYAEGAVALGPRKSAFLQVRAGV